MKNKINFYCDFNIDLIKKILLVQYKISSTSSNYYHQTIQFPKPKNKNGEFCIIWFSLESFKNTYIAKEELKSKNLSLNLDKIISNFFNDVCHISENFKNTILFSFISFKNFKQNPLKSFSEEGDSFIASKLNSFLADKFINIANFNLIDTQLFINNFNESYDIKNWYLTKNPFNLGFNKEISKQINLILKLLSNERKIKIILLDLDNTIWGGEAGERNINDIRLGGHDHIGESYSDFQKSILSLNKEGILIALVSKNEENIAMNIFDNHPDMILKREHISNKRINWEPKYLNIISIMNELNLGLDSALFIDDNPIERESIRLNLPEVNILELPKDPCYYSQALESLDILFSFQITNEDKIRAISYMQNQKRNGIKLVSKSQNSWLEELETNITINEINNSNFSRYLQLLNKTNQFNARTRRITNIEFENWLSLKGNKAYTLRLEDKFGDLGIIALLGYKTKHKNIIIEDFVLSCRAAGRNVEDLMIYLLYEKAKSLNIEKIIIQAYKTKKNAPMINFFKDNKILDEKENFKFEINLKKTNLKKVKYINIFYS